MTQIELGLDEPTGQVERLINWLKSGKTITALESVDRLGIMRLASRIHDAKKFIRIDSRRIKVSNRYGETFSVSEYWWQP